MRGLPPSIAANHGLRQIRRPCGYMEPRRRNFESVLARHHKGMGWRIGAPAEDKRRFYPNLARLGYMSHPNGLRNCPHNAPVKPPRNV